MVSVLTWVQGRIDAVRSRHKAILLNGPRGLERVPGSLTTGIKIDNVVRHWNLLAVARERQLRRMLIITLSNIVLRVRIHGAEAGTQLAGR